jgi:protein-L-isoaspartate(D-aspartate) O-methyltransferase
MRRTVQLALLAVALGFCLASTCSRAEEPQADSPKEEAAMFETQRHSMVKKQLARRDIVDQRVMKAMKKVLRHLFVPETLMAHAYDDSPLPIGHQQTISQPYIVAYMTQAIKTKPDHKVLEIGTGSGYQAAVLAELVAHVYSIEIVEPLGQQARLLLAELGYDNVSVKIGDGYVGWEEHAPFDAIMLTAAPPFVPEPLLKQLQVGGVLIAPVGTHYQELRLYTKQEDGTTVSEVLLPVRFVPMTGKVREEE